MISIIICSRTKQLSPELSQNINASIGCEYELIVIDNSHNDFDIFSAYNHGVELAKGEILCFMHDDIYFHSKQWGRTVEKLFQKHIDLGLLGICGGHVQPRATDWRIDLGYASMHFLQRATTLEISPRYNTHTDYHICHNATRYDKDGVLVKVATADGVWFCIPRSLFKYIHFDETTFKGFHIYDLDISMQVLQTGRTVAVCSNLEIEHFSSSYFSYDFMNQIQLFNQKWASVLPVIEGISISSRKKEKIRSYTSVSRLQKRIERDELRKRIIAKQTAIRNGNRDVSLTAEEDMEVRKTVYRYIRYVIKKKKEYSFPVACKSLWDYVSKDRNPHRFKLVIKFCYYRLLRFGHL